jgi:hypothetical protein
LITINCAVLGSQREFAARTGWSEASVSNFLRDVENGLHKTHKLISPEYVIKAAGAIIDLDTDELYNPWKLIGLVAGFPDGVLPVSVPAHCLDKHGRALPAKLHKKNTKVKR